MNSDDMTESVATHSSRLQPLINNRLSYNFYIGLLCIKIYDHEFMDEDSATTTVRVIIKFQCM